MITTTPLTAPDAVAILRQDLPPGHGEAFDCLARRLGHCPLLLKIVNRQIRLRRRRSSLDEALQEVIHALDVVGQTELDPEDPRALRTAFLRVLVIALRSLPGEDRDRWLDLAVLPPDEDIPLDVVRGLWRLDRKESRQLCKRLSDLSLLGFEPWSGAVRLHPLVSCFLVRRNRGRGAGGGGVALVCQTCRKPRRWGPSSPRPSSPSLPPGRREKRERFV